MSLGKAFKYMDRRNQKDNLYKEIIDFFGALYLLLKEKEFYEEKIEKDPIKFEKLAYTRAYFSYVETVNYRLKYLAFRASQLFDVDLSRAEISTLLEEKYDVTSKGKAESYKKYFPVLNNMRYVDTIYIKYFHLKSGIDFQSKAWNNFTKSIKIRNRITHAKDSNDLKIDEDELEIIKGSFNWYQEYILKIANESLREIMYNIGDEESKEMIDSLTEKIMSFT